MLLALAYVNSILLPFKCYARMPLIELVNEGRRIGKQMFASL